MKNKDLIIDFFEGNLSEDEQKLLLKEIEFDSELKKEFKDYERLYALLNQTKNIKPDEDYLETIIPKFRRNDTKKSFLFKPAFVSSILLLFVTVSIFIYYYSVNSITEFDVLAGYDQINDFSNNLEIYAEFLDNDHLNDLFFTELWGNDDHNSLITNYFEIDNNYNFIPETMAEEVYQELLTKKIL